MSLIMKPEKAYQLNVRAGPYQPTNSESFLENKIISRVGFTMLV